MWISASDALLEVSLSLEEFEETNGSKFLMIVESECSLWGTERERERENHMRLLVLSY